MSVLLGGFAASQMLYVAARLKLADHLASGPMTTADLAGACGAQAEPLRRVVRALAAFDVFAFDGDTIANTELSDCLRAGSSDSLRDVALLYGEEHYHAMSELLHAVTRGGTAFEHAYRKPHFSYLASNPEAAKAYYQAQDASDAGLPASVVDAYDFTNARLVVEVGGGSGRMMRTILHASPRATGILITTAGMARRAGSRMAAEGLDGRCEVRTGDVFSAPPGGADVYVLNGVIHGFDADAAASVLAAIRRVMDVEARLLVIERVIPDEGATSLEAQHAVMSDAVALAVSGGRERTQAEHEGLLTGAGLRVCGVRQVAGGRAIIEASAAG